MTRFFRLAHFSPVPFSAAYADDWESTKGIREILDMTEKKLTESDLSQYSDLIKSPSFENLKVNIETIERMAEQQDITNKKK